MYKIITPNGETFLTEEELMVMLNPTKPEEAADE